MKQKYSKDGFYLIRGAVSDESVTTLRNEISVFEGLANTLTLRVHLDKANRETGVLRVVPGTQKNGRIKSAEILKIVGNSEIVECNANPGDVLLMNPLLFHSSRKATHPTHRRIIHIEYSAMELPPPLEWFE